MSDLALLGARVVVGGYVAAHGAQKLFGAFGGHGIEGTGGFFESLGLTPGKRMAVTAGTSELGGGVLTAAGLAHPVGPLAIASTMGVAAATAHRRKGAFSATGGPELPLTNLAAAAALAAAGTGRYSLDRLLGVRAPSRVVRFTLLASAVAGAVTTARAFAASRRPSEPQPADDDLVVDLTAEDSGRHVVEAVEHPV
ncbi:MAG TPA: DoxX family protein [Acidimicrobiales bacterium]|jgi:putative oxidoreductase